ncbi:MAG: hypothetical protein FJ271_08745 [Planctomycetes bacterium]|nr:hypothetical protein [Planctomycetota bacterium]
MTTVETPQARCNVGVARCDITPPPGIYHRMWGAAAHDRATGVHRPLTATAVVFRDPAHPFNEVPQATAEQVLVAVDHCLLWAPEMNALLTTVCQQASVSRESLAVNFSHTHAAGLMDRKRSHLPGGELIAEYLEGLAVSIARVVQAARQQAQPAIITFGAGRCPLAAHRDFPDLASKQIVCGFNPDGPTDDTIVIARISASDGRLLACIVNYACHPTTLAWDNTLISPDFPGAMRELVEGSTGAPCVFLQGASGDIGPREGFVGDTAVADRNGRQLGHSVLAALEALPPPLTRFAYKGPTISGATIGTWEHRPLRAEDLARLERWHVRRFTVDLPYRGDIRTLEKTRQELEDWSAQERAARAAGDAARAADCRAMAERMTRWLTRLEVLPPGPTFPLPVVMWQTGQAIWLALEGELYNVFQRELRNRFPGVPIVFCTLLNGSRCTYLPTAEAYGKGIYQESIAVLAAGSLEMLLASVTTQVQQMLEV